MAVYSGASTDVAKVVDTHFFLICPNNSGSTFLMKAIGDAQNVWSLSREGQHVFGFSGPNTISNELTLTWGAKQEWIDLFSDPDAYDWEDIRKAWYFQARSKSADSKIFATKSPPFLLIADIIAAQFPNTRFGFMVRDPYATIEGIARRKEKAGLNRQTALELAARHLVTCFDYQHRNIKKYTETGVSFTYEQLCDRPAEIKTKLCQLLPGLGELDLTKKFAVKGIYNEPLRNMNQQQIDRLQPTDFEIINIELEQHFDLFRRFGYEMRGT